VATNGVSLGRFIYSLGIRHVGKHSSELVASSYGTIDGFLNAIEAAANFTNDNDVVQETSATDEDCLEREKSDGSQRYPFPALQNKLGIGPVMIESLMEFSGSQNLVLAARSLSESIRVLKQDIVTGEEETSSSSSMDTARPWKGLRVVFTGSLEGLTRGEAQKLAKLLGAKSTPGSVSKSTDLVVFGEKGGKKLEQAQTLGISTLPADEFLRIVEDLHLLVEKKGSE